MFERFKAIWAARKCPDYPYCDCDPRVPRPGQRMVTVHGTRPVISMEIPDPPPASLLGVPIVEGVIDGQEYKYPHCNSEVLHAPECHYCDAYPNRQRVRAASGTPFTPNESNGWSGNVAVKKGELHSHMGMPPYRVGEGEGF